jgi:zinc and cadmium transporter
MVLVWSLTATLIVSLLSFVGVVGLAINDKLLNKLLLLMIGFAAGSLIGASFLHLLPEALEHCSCNIVFGYTVLGFTFFFVMERYFYWRHCHNGVCDVHAFTYLNLLGDAMHNFTDGMVIAVAFAANFKLGIVATLAIMFHEIPQELGDFSVLVYGGFSKSKALIFNFLCALTAVFGAVTGYVLSDMVNNFSIFLLPFSAGGFIYIAASDLLPELHKQKDMKRANLSFVAFFIGLIFMWIMSKAGGFIHLH